MTTVQLATRIDGRLKAAMDALCRKYGFKIGRFIEDAILDKLEEMEDIEDVRNLRKEPSKPLSDILKELKAHGKL